MSVETPITRKWWSTTASAVMQTFGQLFFTSVLVVLILSAYEPELALEHLDEIPVAALAISGALLALNQLLSCLRYHMLLHDFGFQQPFAVSLRTNIFSIVGGMLLFNFFGQSLTRFAFLKNFDHTPVVAFTITGIERVVALALLLVLAVIGAFVIFGGLGLALDKGGGLILIVANLAVVLAAVFFFELRKRHRRLFRSIVFGELLRPVLRVGVVTIVMHAAMLAAYTVLAVKLAPGAGLADLLSISAIVMLAAALPVSFAGWGVREFSAAYAFGVIGMVPEAGLTMAVSIGLLSLAVLAANTVLAFAVGRGQTPADAAAKPTDPGMAAPLIRLLSLAVPIATAVLVMFQVRLPTASDALNVNLADPIAIVGALILGVMAYNGGRWRVLWRVPNLNVFMTLSTLVLGLGFLHGWAANGISDWALYNRFIGWLVLICYMLTGALVTAAMGRIGFTSMCRVFVIAVAAIVLTEITLRFVDQFDGLRFFTWPSTTAGMLGNPNAFALQVVLALTVAISTLSRSPASRKGVIPVAVSGLLLAGLWFAQSRAAFVGALSFILIFLYLDKAHLKRIVVGLIVAGVIVAAVNMADSLLVLLADGETQGHGIRLIRGVSDLTSVQADRWASLTAGLEMWSNNPIFGAGLGAFIQSQIEMTGTPLIIHNSALWIAAEMGVVGLIVFALLPIAVLHALYKDRAWRTEWSGVVVLGSLAALAVMSMFHDFLYQRAFWLLAGAAVAAPRCLARKSVPASLENIQPAPMINLDAATVEGFDKEWTTYDQTSVDDTELRGIFDDYFRVFPWSALPADAVGFDAGCGTGRWALFVAERVGHLHCIDASAGALGVARRMLSATPNSSFHLASVDDMPIDDAAADFGYSLGVLHHLPDTAAGLAACVRKLKPGAPFLVYLYYAFDNRPTWYRALWGASDGVRRIVSTLPFGPRHLITEFVAAVVYWPLARAAKLVEMLGADARNLPLAAYRDKSYYTMRTDSLDRFGTTLEHRYTRDEIDRMMRAAGLERIVFSDESPFWCAVGYRKG